MNWLITILILLGAMALGLALAYLPLRIMLSTMAKNVRQFIQRQRDRRREARETPDRRKTAP